MKRASRREGSLQRMLWWLGLLAVLCGCEFNRKPLASFRMIKGNRGLENRGDSLWQTELAQAKDVQANWLGEVTAGQVIGHSFRYQNNTGTRLVLRDEQIRPSCGCTSVQVKTRQLEPNEVAEVALAIDTRGKTGRFEETVELGWQDSEGTVHHHRFRLGGVAVPPVVFDPPDVTFSKTDVRLGRRKTVRCDVDRSVNWSLARAVPSHDYLQVEDWKVDPNGKSAIFNVFCRPTDSGDVRRAYIQIELPCERHGGKQENGSEVIRADVSVLSDDLQELRVSPRELVVNWRSNAGERSLRRDATSIPSKHQSVALPRQGVGTLVITGDAVPGGLTLESVRAGAKECVWESSSIGSNALKVKVYLVSDPCLVTEKPQRLVLHFSDGRQVSVGYR